jgi:hypothetical protein
LCKKIIFPYLATAVWAGQGRGLEIGRGKGIDLGIEIGEDHRDLGQGQGTDIGEIREEGHIRGKGNEVTETEEDLDHPSILGHGLYLVKENGEVIMMIGSVRDRKNREVMLRLQSTMFQLNNLGRL